MHGYGSSKFEVGTTLFSTMALDHFGPGTVWALGPFETGATRAPGPFGTGTIE